MYMVSVLTYVIVVSIPIVLSQCVQTRANILPIWCETIVEIIRAPEYDALHCMLQENAGGVSRDEMAAVLMEVVDGRLPKDRIALRELYNEILGWPWLEAEEDQTEGVGEAVADYEGITPTGAVSNAASFCIGRAGAYWPEKPPVLPLCTCSYA